MAPPTTSQPSRGLERLIRRVERMRRAHRARRGARGQRNGRLPIGLHQRGLIERGLDPLPFAGLEAVRIRREDSHAREQSSGDVGQRRTALHGRTVGTFAGKAHDAAHGLGDQIEAAAVLVRTGTAEARQRAIDQRREFFVQRLVSEAEALHRAGRKVLDQHVGVRDQPSQHRFAAVGLEVQHDAALVAVHHQEGGRLIADLRRHRMAGVVAIRRFLDLDDVGAHVGQHQGAGRPGHDMGEIDDLEAGKRPRTAGD
ncbi:hypothetical protein ACVWYI_004078 [Bradyrhizobium sp. LB13.1]